MNASTSLLAHATQGHRTTAASEWRAALPFLLVFPGFFIYHTLVSAGWIPSFLAGYSNAIAVIVLPLVLWRYGRGLLARRAPIPGMDTAFFALVAYFVVCELVGLVAGADPAIALPHLVVALQYVMLFFLFRVFDPVTPGSRQMLWGSVAVMSGIVFFNVTEGAFVIAALDLQVGEKRFSTYQGYAYVYMVSTLLLVTGTRRLPTRLLLYAIGAPALFFNGARSEFAAFLAMALVIEACLARRRTLFVLAAAATAGATMLIAPWLSDLLPDNRVLGLLDYSADASVNERQPMITAAWKTLAEHPILGAYASYPLGEYAHNLLSVWVDFGVLGLALFSTLIFAPLVDLLRRFSQHAREPAFVGALVFMGTAALMHLTAKNHEYPILPIAFALYIRYRSKRAVTTPARAVPSRA